jgi:hypothetical protein
MSGVYEGHFKARNAGLFAWSDECAKNQTGHQELHLGRKATRAVPTAATVKQLASSWAQVRDDMLQIGSRARRCSERRRIQRPAPAGEERKAHHPTPDFEAAGADVSVRQAVAREVEEWPNQDCGEPGSTRGTGRGARRDVEGNNHGRPVLPRPAHPAGPEVVLSFVSSSSASSRDTLAAAPSASSTRRLAIARMSSRS